jgi:hypothetical protein
MVMCIAVQNLQAQYNESIPKAGSRGKPSVSPGDQLPAFSPIIQAGYERELLI